MASSGYIKTGVKTIAGDPINLILSWSQASQDIANNRTTISWNIKPTNMDFSNSWFYAHDLWVNINGVKTQIISSSTKITNNQVIRSGTVTISHNNDGTKTFKLSFGASIYYTGSNNMLASGTGTLNRIPRQSKIKSITAGTLGSAVTVNLIRYNSNYTHKIEYALTSSGKWHIAGTSYGETATFTPPVDLASNIPNSVSGTLFIRVTTYNDNTLVGMREQSSTVIRVPSTACPKVTLTVIPNNGLTGLYVQTKSRVNVKVNFEGSYGSTLKASSTVIRLGGSTISWQSSSSTNFTSNIFTNAGKHTISVIVKDSRGRSGSYSTTIDVQEYIAPKIGNIKVFRANASGNYDDKGNTIKIKANALFTNLSYNNKTTVTVKYKEKTATTWVDIYTYKNVYSQSIDLTVPANKLKQYIVKVTLKDNFNEVVLEKHIRTEFTTVDFLAGGKGIGIGRIINESETIAINNLWSVVGGCAREIGANKDLNDYKEQGLYYQTSDSYAEYGKNYPQPYNGWLEVFVFGNQVYQRYSISTGARIWSRRFNGAVWNTWRKIEFA